MNLVIHFNPSGGYEEEALSLARRLFAQYDEAIESLAIIPVADENLDLWLDGRLVHSLTRSGESPRVMDLRETLAQSQT
ncbi:MAG TPA: Rdx family protein [Chloroflexota bacterium]|nr:Rdx family protein [Chloroflexota bacterium]